MCIRDRVNERRGRLLQQLLAVVAQFTCEAELLAISTAMSEGLYVVHLLGEIGINVSLRLRSD
eukprot:13480277-Heterocapsa_arctica.AAC.1